MLVRRAESMAHQTGVTLAYGQGCRVWRDGRSDPWNTAVSTTYHDNWRPARPGVAPSRRWPEALSPPCWCIWGLPIPRRRAAGRRVARVVATASVAATTASATIPAATAARRASAPRSSPVALRPVGANATSPPVASRRVSLLGPNAICQHVAPVPIARRAASALPRVAPTISAPRSVSLECLGLRE